MVGSMGQVGSAGDNAAMESFFALLQKNVLDRRSWATRDELRIEIITWIERTYHRRRRQARLGRLTPIEYEMIMTPQTAPPPDYPPVTSTRGSPDSDSALAVSACCWTWSPSRLVSAPIYLVACSETDEKLGHGRRCGRDD